MNYYHIDDGVRIQVELYDGTIISPLVCPECVNHQQMPTSDVCDCKNVFYRDDKNNHGRTISVAQCNCWSSIHGRKYPQKVKLFG